MTCPDCWTTSRIAGITVVHRCPTHSRTCPHTGCTGTRLPYSDGCVAHDPAVRFLDDPANWKKGCNK
jgi:hypothetical protein